MSTPSIPDRPAVRVSDRERERHVELLRGHAVAGRLSVDELDERVGLAYAARTRDELEALLRDLPAPAPAERPVRPPRRRALDGELAAYVAVNVVLIGIWAVTGAGYFWPVWPLLGWGVGLAPKLLGVPGFGPCRYATPRLRARRSA